MHRHKPPDHPNLQLYDFILAQILRGPGQRPALPSYPRKLRLQHRPNFRILPKEIYTLTARFPYNCNKMQNGERPELACSRRQHR